MSTNTDPLYQKLLKTVQAVREDRLRMRGELNLLPHTEASIPSSRDKQRTITAHIYEPQGAPAKGPVVINFHGSGFILPSLGQNTHSCSYLAEKSGFRFVDADYAKAPELPFPNCWFDAADVIRWTLAQEWCNGSIALHGFSAGGAIAIGFSAPSVALKYGLSQAESDAIKAVVAYYPATGSSTEERLAGPNVKQNDWLEANGIPGVGFNADALNLFYAAYLYGSDPAELKKMPELAPRYADPSMWAKPLTIITCEYDTLEAEAADFANKLKAQGKDVVLMQTEGTSHGWETRVGNDPETDWTDQTKGGVAKKEAYELDVKRLKEALKA